jgi:hypothetical protein
MLITNLQDKFAGIFPQIYATYYDRQVNRIGHDMTVKFLLPFSQYKKEDNIGIEFTMSIRKGLYSHPTLVTTLWGSNSTVSLSTNLGTDDISKRWAEGVQAIINDRVSDFKDKISGFLETGVTMVENDLFLPFRVSIANYVEHELVEANARPVIRITVTRGPMSYITHWNYDLKGLTIGHGDRIKNSYYNLVERLVHFLSEKDDGTDTNAVIKDWVMPLYSIFHYKELVVNTGISIRGNPPAAPSLGQSFIDEDDVLHVYGLNGWIRVDEKITPNILKEEIQEKELKPGESFLFSDGRKVDL